ncbi:hypothetical protein H4R34_004938 [Dimargaris verticillata]|uniref:Dihydrolipoamide acetyltransferase component of pyruvate dehydrogenase complex n=1 Tax=Dimargaris verticillata TaxID=2761393 RepID=A0A9W8AXY3_9FUNG|nr:hypothetical protein H4R34_004938 [Dimargaris verticillata]
MAMLRPLARGLSYQPRQNKVVPFNLADIGEGITECEIIQWFVKPGDTIAQFDQICEVQSDKASVEITSRYDGTVKKLHYEAGSMARVGQPLVDIDVSDSHTSDTPAASFTPPAPTPLSEPSSQPVAMPAPSNSQSATLVPPPILQPTTGKPSSEILAIPAVRRLAKEHGLNLALLTGTGKGGRITKEDVLRHMAQPTTAAASPLSAEPKSVAGISMDMTDSVVPLSPVQKSMYTMMTNANNIVRFALSDEIEIGNCMVLRADINKWLTEHGEATGYSLSKITYLPIFLKCMSLAIQRYPIFNARLINEDQGPSKIQLQHRSEHHISVAMDTPNGLLVPTVRDVHTKSVLQIAQDLERLKELGRRNALKPVDLQPGTITLSNIGNIGGTVLSPVVPLNTLCLGALGRIQRLPRFQTVVDPVTQQAKEIVVPKHILHVSWVADHRVIDGATLARFSNYWKELLTSPAIGLSQLK